VDWYLLAQFFAATLLLLVTPGPVIAIVTHNTAWHGSAAGLLTVVGVGLGDACLLGATLAGLRFSSEFLPLVFRWLSLAGALYLIWLAVEALLVRRRISRRATLSRCRKPLLDGLTIAFSNPAALMFYAAFFPQFIDRNGSIAEQMIVLSVLYICTRLTVDAACVLAVARVRLPAGWAQIGRLAELGSAVVYLSVAVVTVIRFIEASG
jgi:threonine/homoserine/homoserine lactone efflux protein